MTAPGSSYAFLALTWIGSACGAGVQAQEPEFARDVAPLLHRSCAPCHHEGGTAPFPLLTYRDAAKRSRQIVKLTGERVMPPWGPIPGHGEFLDSRWLSEAEVALLARWHAAGTPLGNAEDLPPEPSFPKGWKLGEPDVVLTMDEAYRVPAEGFEFWRTFVVPTGFENDRYLRAVDFDTGGSQALHHFVMYFDGTGYARRRAAEEEGVGYAGMTAEVNFGGDELFGWLPGMTPRPLREGSASFLPAGTDLVLDTHLVTTGRSEDVKIKVGLYFSEQPPTLLPVRVLMIGPGATVPPGHKGYTIASSMVMPVDVMINAIQPHAHYITRGVEVWAEEPRGNRINLLRIDRWDPDWQDIYRYAEPVRLVAGTRVEMRFTYDNTAENGFNPFSPPRRVVTGVGTYDEMAITLLSCLVTSKEDARTLRAYERAKFDANTQSATGLTSNWKALVQQYDEDKDGSLDAEEEARATTFVNTLRERPKHVLAGFDEDKDGQIDAREDARIDYFMALWNGTPPEPAE